MNKSLVVNLIAFLCTVAGYFIDNHIVFTVGIFALSGAITNWLAIHMLFEKVPGLYGSGVIPARFEDFKLGIRELMMEQFFTQENIQRFLSSNNQQSSPVIDLSPIINKVDLSPAFDNLIKVIENSSFGSMLAMVGGSEVLQPLREPFIEEMKITMSDIAKSDEFGAILNEELSHSGVSDDMRDKVSDIIEKRLNELTPQLVKTIIQNMIKQHLGWLVVWGGVFGGIIGLIAAITQTY
ncbi:DUF445 domain-containing protein [Colwellia sp. RE-S-Sl-9]